MQSLRSHESDRRDNILNDRLASLKNKHKNILAASEMYIGPTDDDMLPKNSPQKTKFPKLLLNEPSQASIRMIQESAQHKINDPAVLAMGNEEKL